MLPQMLPQCAHTLQNGCQCRRIPKRGQSFCPAHSAPHRRRPFEENDAFRRHISVFSDHLRFMPLDDLLYAAGEMLHAVHPLIDLRSRRRDRLTFSRASATVTIAATRLRQSFLDFSRQQASAQPPAFQLERVQPRPTQLRPAPPTPISAFRPAPSPTTPNRLTEEQREQLQSHLYHTPPNLVPEELEAWIDQALSIFDSDTNTTPTLNSDR